MRIGLPAGRLGPRRRRRAGAAGRGGRGRRADHRRRRPGPLPRPGEGRREVRRRCPPWAGTAPTAAATSCGSRRRGWSSSAAPTTRSSSAAGGSSSARSTRALQAPARGGRRRRRRAHAPRRDTSSWSATSSRRRRRASTSPRAARAAARPRCRPRWCRRSPSWTRCRPAPRARSTGTPCRGRWQRIAADEAGADLAGTAAWLAELWTDVLGVAVDRPGRTTSSTSAAAAWRPPSWSRGCATRYPEVTVADVYEQPAPRRPGRRRSTSSRRAGRAGATRTVAPDAAPDPGRAESLVTVPLRAAGRAALADLARGAGATWPARPAVRAGLPTVSLVVGARSAGCCSSARSGRMAIDRRRSPGCCCAGCGPGATRAAAACTCGSGSPSGSPTRWAPPTWPARRGSTYYARALGRQGRPRRRPALAAAGHRAADAGQGLRRSSPRSTSPATGSTATCCTSGASGSARAPASGTRSILAARRPRRAASAEVARRLGRLRLGAARASAGPGRPRVLVGRRAAPLARPARPAAAGLGGGVRR